jgi:hypothetical protein
MNYSQSFEEFSSSVGPTDLALYAGVGIALFVLFKDRLSPVQKVLIDFLETAKKWFQDTTKPKPPVVGPLPDFPVPTAPPLVRPQVETKNVGFLDLVASWKQTRDLSKEYGCEQATEMLDQVFQYLSPVVCLDEEKNNEQ